MIIKFNVFLIIAVPLWILFRIINIKSNRYKGLKEEICINLLFIYLLYLAEMTVFPLSIGISFKREISLVPFRTIAQFMPNLLKYGLITNSWRPHLGSGAINILGNIVVFIPVGILIPLINIKFDKFIKSTAAGFSISLLIEVIQLCFVQGRHFDVDDLMLNTLGVVIGWCIYKIFLALINSFNKRGIDS
jgi:glycopeptide antibiotics resistance protein